MKSNPEFISAQRRWLGARQSEAARKYVAERRNNDPGFKLLLNLRGRIRAALKGAGKSRQTMQLIGCSIAELKAHLESLFMPGMSWSNYGEWHVDHVIPCCAFDLRSADDQRRCFHFTNLQPLWADDNFKKSGKNPNT
ncbi:MAG: hypothetical protein DME33_13420 [Verrucomicrobia bacterium]|nr:MAG: hypothetical protein DME33_13420 [Verrucomicrobiota bacterium]